VGRGPLSAGRPDRAQTRTACSNDEERPTTDE